MTNAPGGLSVCGGGEGGGSLSVTVCTSLHRNYVAQTGCLFVQKINTQVNDPEIAVIRVILVEVLTCI